MTNKEQQTSVKLDEESIRQIEFIKAKTGLKNTSEVVRQAIKANYDHLEEDAFN